MFGMVLPLYHIKSLLSISSTKSAMVTLSIYSSTTLYISCQTRTVLQAGDRLHGLGCISKQDTGAKDFFRNF